MLHPRFIILFFLFIASVVRSQEVIIDLSAGKWEFKEADSVKWHPAIVPGCVHTDLMANKLIPDPFYRDNEKSVQWVESRNWNYRTSFDAGVSLFAHERIDIVFEGLDTYADVFLNGVLLLHADNMFRTWEVNCRKALKAGRNELLITFTSASALAKAAYEKLPVPLPYDERVMVRKAPYQFGWDWGPRLVTAGIWRPVTLKAWNGARIKDLWYSQNSLTDEQAELVFHAVIGSEKNQKAELKLIHDNKVLKVLNIDVHHGSNNIDIPYTLIKPELWWPAGLGNQKQYSFGLSLSLDSKLTDSSGIKMGLRTIELVQEKDSTGKSFFFRVNGLPVFMKGANYIPQDNFPSRVTAEKYNRLVSDVAGSGMNMLRVWGGGIYESGHFYDLCDEKGILVWQDLMFACAMYPGDSAFMDNVSREVEDNVGRLRDHPCIALWCGNNEIDEGWKNWGMQKQFKYKAADSARIWNDYLRLFQDVIPGILMSMDGQRPYCPSSPLNGWGRKESMTEGDAHYWGVWWGDEPFEVYKTKVPRFMSEFGFQGFPAIQTLNECTEPGDRDLASEVLKNHEKHPRGLELISSAMLRDYWIPDDLRKFALLSQIVQARGMRVAIEAQRRAKPYCMGSLYWQLNDCWPAISWSGIDHNGNWKAAEYAVKRAFAPVLVSPVVEKDLFRIYIVSDETEPDSASMEVSIMDNTGKKVFLEIKAVSFTTVRSNIVYKKPLKEFLQNFDTARCFVYVRLFNEKKDIASNTMYFCKPANYKHAEANIKKEFRQTDGLQWSLKLATDVPVPIVFIESDLPGLRFSDNYFDLMPGEAKTIMITSEKGINDIEGKLRVSSLYMLR